ncbi:MAG: ankyrin repeat domain-containing protein [Verrucomicrobiae bacterium]|nr:ankyrin repeat domain-containing protein [Verrucomicrobiae bacterium]
MADPGALDKLLAVGGIDARDERGRTPLHLALLRGDEKRATDLISKGADIHTRTKEGWRPLHFAAKSGNVRLCQMLLKAGAQVDGKNPPFPESSAKMMTFDCRDQSVRTVFEDLASKAGIQAEIDPNLIGTVTAHFEETTPREAIRMLARELGYSWEWRPKQGLLIVSPQDKMAVAPQSPIQLAIDGNNLKLVKLFLEGGTNPEFAPNGYSPYFWAVKTGKVGLLPLFLQKGWDVNTGLPKKVEAKASNKTETPVNPNTQPVVIEYVDQDLVTILLALSKRAEMNLIVGSGVNGVVTIRLTGVSFEDAIKIIAVSKELSCQDDGKTIFISKEPGAASVSQYEPSLFTAIANDQPKVVEFLLGRGASRNMRNRDVLVEAAERGNEEVVEMLLREKPDLIRGSWPKERMESNPSSKPLPADFADSKKTESSGVQLSYREEDLNSILRSLARRADINLVIGPGVAGKITVEGNFSSHEEALKSIAEAYQYEYTRDDILNVSYVRRTSEASSAPLLSNTKPNQTALHAACDHGREGIVKMLVDRGADVNVRDWFGNTPLHFAVQKRKKGNTVCLLIDHGADIRAINEAGETPLHKAVHSGRADMVLLLLEKGAPVNGKSFLGHTPLSVAVNRGNSAILEILLKHGAHPDGLNPEHNPKQSAPLVKGPAANLKEEIHPVLRNLARQCGINLIVRGVDEGRVIVPAGTPQNALREIIAMNNLSWKWNAATHTLVLWDQNGVEKQDAPLLQAVRGQKYALVRILLESGADPDATDIRGQTPLEIAKKNKDDRMVNLLQETRTGK